MSRESLITRTYGNIDRLARVQDPRMPIIDLPAVDISQFTFGPLMRAWAEAAGLDASATAVTDWRLESATHGGIQQALTWSEDDGLLRRFDSVMSSGRVSGPAELPWTARSVEYRFAVRRQTTALGRRDAYATIWDKEWGEGGLMLINLHVSDNLRDDPEGLRLGHWFVSAVQAIEGGRKLVQRAAKQCSPADNEFAQGLAYRAQRFLDMADMVGETSSAGA